MHHDSCKAYIVNAVLWSGQNALMLQGNVQYSSQLPWRPDARPWKLQHERASVSHSQQLTQLTKKVDAASSEGNRKRLWPLFLNFQVICTTVHMQVTALKTDACGLNRLPLSQGKNCLGSKLLHLLVQALLLPDYCFAEQTRYYTLPLLCHMC